MYAVLFDIDGTLLLTGGAGKLAFTEAFAAEFGVTELCGDVPYAGRSDQAISQDLMKYHGVAPTQENWERFREAYLARLPSALARRQGRVLPGVTALLDSLAAIDHSLLGLLTGNVQAGARHKLVHYGLAERFGFGGYGDVSDQRCDIAAAAVAGARSALNERTRSVSGDLAGIMVIGDTVHDIHCARAVGAAAVAVATGGTSREELADAGPDLLLDDLTTADPILDFIDFSMQR
jgi:phosphoglycolate phosphatase-like HAD superfamily hydrolase